MTTTPRMRSIKRPARRLQQNPPTRHSKGLPSYRWEPHDVLLQAGFRGVRVPQDWRGRTDPEDLHKAAIREAEELNDKADAYLATGRSRNHARPNRHPIDESRSGRRTAGSARRAPQPFEIVNPQAIFDPPKPHPEPAPWQPMEPRAPAQRTAQTKPLPLLEPEAALATAGTATMPWDEEPPVRRRQATLDLPGVPEPRPGPVDIITRLQASFAEKDATIRRLAGEVTATSHAKEAAEARAKRLERRLEAIQTAIREALDDAGPETAPAGVAQENMH